MHACSRRLHLPTLAASQDASRFPILVNMMLLLLLLSGPHSRVTHMTGRYF